MLEELALPWVAQRCGLGLNGCMVHIETSGLVPAERTLVFDYLTNPQNLPELIRDFIEVELVSVDQPAKRGTEYEFLMTRFGISQEVTFRVEDWLRGTRMVYRQTKGIFSLWTHTMKFEDHGEHQTRVSDFVDYELPLGLLGHLANDLFFRRNMKQILQARIDRAKAHFSRGSHEEVRV